MSRQVSHASSPHLKKQVGQNRCLKRMEGGGAQGKGGAGGGGASGGGAGGGAKRGRGNVVREGEKNSIYLLVITL